MTKHFKAVHKETKEEIPFGLEDIRAFQSTYPEQWLGIGIGLRTLDKTQGLTLTLMGSFLKDYELFYQHGGNWYKYG